jgi:uncharacterized cupredoxin-like copper-binding protein
LNGRRLLACLAALLSAALVASACGGNEGAEPTPSGPTLSVQLDEWKVVPASSTAVAGALTFQVQNVGTMDHEMLVIRSDLDPKDLPTRSGEVDEDRLEVAGKTKALKRREKMSLSLTLQPGSYVLICNVSGHYSLGMTASIQVR